MKKKDSNQTSWFSILKELWKVPRYKSLITLGLYGIFFLSIYLIILISSMFNKPEENYEIDPIDMYSQMESYEYIYDIKSNLYTYEVNGTYVNGKDNFSINNNDFYIENNIISAKNIQINLPEVLSIDLLMIRPNILANIFTKENLKSKTEYENGNTKEIYNVLVTDFNITFLQEPYDSSKYIEFTVYIEDNLIKEINIDLSEIMQVVNSNIQSYTIDISYSNINNIKSVEEF